MRLPSFILDLVTSRDGVSWDPLRVGVIVSGATLLFLSGWDVIINKQAFNALTFGSGVGALLGGAGLGIGAKHKDEPNA
jgi:hypothetical protein